LQSTLYGVVPADPTVFAACLAVLIGVSIAAGWIPARRAAQVDPAELLRRE